MRSIKNQIALKLFMALVFFSGCFMAFSKTITVTSDADYDPGKPLLKKISGLCLRDAIAQAQDGDVIEFDLPGDSNEPKIIEVTSEIVLTKRITFDGGNDGITYKVTDIGKSAWRVFFINAPGKTVTFKNKITILGGNVSENAESSLDSDGGGIYVATGTLNLTDVTISGSKAKNGGGIYINTGATANISGGAINSCIATEHGGGGIYNNNGTLTISKNGDKGTTINDNTYQGIQLYYNGVEPAGTVIITGATINGNTTDDDAGGINNIGMDLTVTDCIISNNKGKYGGGIRSSSNSHSEHPRNATLILDSSTVKGNTATGDVANHPSGGGIANEWNCTATIRNNCIIGYKNAGDAATDKNTSYIGGGIFNAGKMTITDSTIGYNTATLSGEAVGDSGGGGGIANITNDASSAPNLTIERSTICGNSADIDGGGILSYQYHPGGTAPVLTMTNCTVSGNSVTYATHGWPFDCGGGLLLRNSNTTLSSVTIVNNTTGSNHAAGIYACDGGSLAIKNSIMAGNSDGGGNFNFFKTNAVTFTDNGYNAMGWSSNETRLPDRFEWDQPGDWNWVSGDISTGTFQLYSISTTGSLYLNTILADNGGSTYTHAITDYANSKLYSITSDNSWNGTPDKDQRGQNRTTTGAYRAIGAYDDSGNPHIPLKFNKMK